MPDYDNTNTVVINQNDKGDNPKRADLNLDINVDGVRYFAKAWKKSGSNGSFYSGPLERADDKYQPDGATTAPANSTPGDDDIPF